MGTEVLLPQDVLGKNGIFRLSPSQFHRRRNIPDNGNGNLTNNRKASPKGENRRANTRRSNEIGPVTLLKRGQSLDSLISKKSGKPRAEFHPADDLAVLGTGRIGPESPEMMPKRIHLVPPPVAKVYAGSAFSLSPSPNSLPLPSFFNKKQQNDSVVNDSATRDLRRLLRLD